MRENKNSESLSGPRIITLNLFKNQCTTTTTTVVDDAVGITFRGTGWMTEQPVSIHMNSRTCQLVFATDEVSQFVLSSLMITMRTDADSHKIMNKNVIFFVVLCATCSSKMSISIFLSRQHSKHSSYNSFGPINQGKNLHPRAYVFPWNDFT